ncbi:MAG: tetratricopeptide repeat protein [Planctomyces sp.]
MAAKQSAALSYGNQSEEPSAYARHLDVLRRNVRYGTAFDFVFRHHTDAGTLREFARTLAATDNASPQSIHSRILAGQFLLELGDADAAIIALSKADSEQPNDSQITILLGLARYLEGQTSEAISDLERAVEKGRRRQEVMPAAQLLCRMYQLTGHPESSGPLIRRIIDRFPADRSIRELSADILTDAGDTVSAVSLLKQLAEECDDFSERVRFQTKALETQLFSQSSAEVTLASETLLTDVWTQKGGDTALIGPLEALIQFTAGRTGLINYYENQLTAHRGNSEQSSAFTSILRKRLLELRLETPERSTRSDRIETLFQEVLSDSPTSEELLRSRLKFLVADERSAEASDIYSILHRRAPDNQQLLREWIEFSARRQDLARTDQQKHLKSLIERYLRQRHPESDPDDLLNLSRILQSAGHPDDAIRLMRHVAELSPDSVVHRLILAELLHVSGDTVEARAILEAVSMGLQSQAPDEKSVDLELRLSESSWKFGERDRAITTARGNPEVTPPGETALRRSRWLSDHGDHAGALQLLRKATPLVDADQRDRMIAEQIRIHLASGTLNQTVNELTQRLEEQGDASSADDWLFAARMFHATGRQRETLAAVRRALSISPEFLPALKLLPSIFYQQDQSDDAVSCLRQLIARDPENANRYRKSLIRWQIAAGEIDSAVQTADECVQTQPNDDESLQLLVAICLKANQPERAVAAVRKSLTTTPEANNVRVLLADLLDKTSHIDEAIQTEWLICHTPSASTDRGRSIGRLLKLSVKHGTAEELIRRLRLRVLTDPNRLSAVLTLGQALETLNRSTEAEQLLQNQVNSIPFVRGGLPGAGLFSGQSTVPDSLSSSGNVSRTQKQTGMSDLQFSTTLFRELARLAKSRGESAASLRYLESALKYSADDGLRTEISLKLAQTEQAKEITKLWLGNEPSKLHPDDIPTELLRLIDTMATSNRLQPAETVCNEAIARSPDSIALQFRKACLHRAAGDRESARRVFRQIVFDSEPKAESPADKRGLSRASSGISNHSSASSSAVAETELAETLTVHLHRLTRLRTNSESAWEFYRQWSHSDPNDQSTDRRITGNPMVSGPSDQEAITTTALLFLLEPDNLSHAADASGFWNSDLSGLSIPDLSRVLQTVNALTESDRRLSANWLKNAVVRDQLLRTSSHRSSNGVLYLNSLCDRIVSSGHCVEALPSAHSRTEGDHPPITAEELSRAEGLIRQWIHSDPEWLLLTRRSGWLPQLFPKETCDSICHELRQLASDSVNPALLTASLHLIAGSDEHFEMQLEFLQKLVALQPPTAMPAPGMSQDEMVQQSFDQSVQKLVRQTFDRRDWKNQERLLEILSGLKSVQPEELCHSIVLGCRSQGHRQYLEQWLQQHTPQHVANGSSLSNSLQKELLLQENCDRDLMRQSLRDWVRSAPDTKGITNLSQQLLRHQYRTESLSVLRHFLFDRSMLSSDRREIARHLLQNVSAEDDAQFVIPAAELLLADGSSLTNLIETWPVLKQFGFSKGITSRSATAEFLPGDIISSRTPSTETLQQSSDTDQLPERTDPVIDSAPDPTELLSQAAEYERADMPQEACKLFLQVLDIDPGLFAADLETYAQSFEYANMLPELITALDRTDLSHFERSVSVLIRIATAAISSETKNESGQHPARGLLKKLVQDFPDAAVQHLGIIESSRAIQPDDIAAMIVTSLLPSDDELSRNPWHGLTRRTEDAFLLSALHRLCRENSMRESVSERIRQFLNSSEDWIAGPLILRLISDDGASAPAPLPDAESGAAKQPHDPQVNGKERLPVPVLNTIADVLTRCRRVPEEYRTQFQVASADYLLAESSSSSSDCEQATGFREHGSHGIYRTDHDEDSQNEETIDLEFNFGMNLLQARLPTEAISIICLAHQRSSLSLNQMFSTSWFTDTYVTRRQLGDKLISVAQQQLSEGMVDESLTGALIRSFELEPAETAIKHRSPFFSALIRLPPSVRGLSQDHLDSLRVEFPILEILDDRSRLQRDGKPDKTTRTRESETLPGLKPAGADAHQELAELLDELLAQTTLTEEQFASGIAGAIRINDKKRLTEICSRLEGSAPDVNRGQSEPMLMYLGLGMATSLPELPQYEPLRIKLLTRSADLARKQPDAIIRIAVLQTCAENARGVIHESSDNGGTAEQLRELGSQWEREADEIITNVIPRDDLDESEFHQFLKDWISVQTQRSEKSSE